MLKISALNAHRGGKMKIIGYMLGTDPEVLTQLLLEGYETLPLSNGYDNHGNNEKHNKANDVKQIGRQHIIECHEARSKRR